jgi:ABC-2 type transport system ATP-binding protein
VTAATETATPARAAAAEGSAARPPRGEVVIATRALTKRYGDFTAVDALDLEIRAGEVFGLLGPNGAGKTTTVLMLLGLSEPTEGEALVLGLDPAREPLRVKHRVGYLPDNVGFYGGMSGRENLRYTARLNGLRRAAADDRIDALLQQVRLDDAADRRVDTYSRGMRQRLGIADALVKDPAILILDEPTIALDPQGVIELLELIRRLADEEGIAILLSSHLLEQVQEVCDRVGIFVAGRMVAQGTVDELARTMRGGPVTLELVVDGDHDAVERVLRDLPEVSAVRPDAVRRREWRVEGTERTREALLPALAGAGLLLIELRSRGEELDAIYQRFVSGQGGRAGQAAVSPREGDR